jgi:hypothetical protein
VVRIAERRRGLLHTDHPAARTALAPPERAHASVKLALYPRYVDVVPVKVPLPTPVQQVVHKSFPWGQSEKPLVDAQGLFGGACP